MEGDNSTASEPGGPSPEQIAAEAAAHEQPVAPSPTPPPPAPPPHPPGAPHVPPLPPYGGYYQPPAAPPSRRGFPWWGWLIGGCLGLVVVGGVACVALGIAFGRFATTLASETPVTTSASQSFSVTGVPTVVVRDAVGKVDIQAGTADTVSIQYTKKATARSTGTARNDLNRITVILSQTGNTITVAVSQPAAPSPFSQLSVDLTISVPTATNLELQLGTGDVQVVGTQGTLSLTTRVGDAELDEVTLQDGSMVALSTGTLTFNGALASGANVAFTVGTGGALVRLPAATSAHLDASTTIGSLSISGWNIPVHHAGTGASAVGDLGTPASGTLRLRMTTGTIDLATSQ